MFKFFKRKVLYRENGTVPYLIRLTIFQCKFFSIKTHRVLCSDTGSLHDHPWSYISFILRGGYFELTYDQDKNIVRKWYGPGSILIRNAAVPHKLEIPTGKYCTSLIFTSRKWRDWGIFSSNGWLSHTKFSK